MTLSTRWTAAHGIVTLSPRGDGHARTYAWRTVTGARVSGYCQTVRQAETAFRVLARR